MKRLSITELEDKLLLKVEHQVKNMLTGVSIFLVEEGKVQEITPGILSEEEEKKIISRDYDRVATPEEIEMAHEILVKRDQHVLLRVEKTLQAIGGVQLLRVIEMGGRYFAYTIHDNLIYSRLAEVLLTPEDLPMDFMEVPAEFLPLLAENISTVLLQDDKKSFTVQFGEGLFLRLNRNGSTIYSTVMKLEGEGKESRLQAPFGFVLKRGGKSWISEPDEKKVNRKRMEDEMKKALNVVFGELSSAVQPK